jgi:trans-aconitate 2-methyltransferase
MQALAEEVLDRLALQGHETVLDAGTGSGRVAAVLIERLPEGRVIAVDASPSMIEQARPKLRAKDEAFVSDLLELELPAPVDAILSTATFHWIPDHDLLFARLFAALEPGGRLEAQCGGHGNVVRVHEKAHSVAAEEPFDHWFAGWQGPWNFQTAEATEARLRDAGFEEVRCWLEPREVSPEEPLAYLTAICLGAHLERLPEDLRRPFAERVLARLGEPLVLDYVRLNISARRPA